MRCFPKWTRPNKRHSTNQKPPRHTPGRSVAYTLSPTAPSPDRRAAIRYEDDDAYDVDANWCPDCGEPRGVCTCGPMCQECGGTMELETSYEAEEPVVVHQYWCETCRVLRDFAEAR